MTGKDIKDTIGVVNPHDKLIREIYSDRDNAHSFLANHLPGKVLDLVEMSSLEISKDSFIDQDLADCYSDILYRVKLRDGSAGFIYLLFEHKSYNDKYVHLQLLEYEDELSLEEIKEMAEQAISKATGEYIMTLAEKLRKEGEERGKLEGKLEGLKETIELGITLKFPEDIDTVMISVNKIDDLEILVKIKETIKTAKDNSEILALLK
ncbi:Rpn family recombination-promoting nuclease/putative transposase [Desulfobacter vibrioformis]|uniref:Rpn family recombination-promoting nuclease/putative transposase n=1 Tax=Desulfobacter vibrioformis TaxID=34031 RepID=UPI0005541B51|nr:Rpn family recombination-promoting nuclease/putative transposase [Desulfobacter vibrioformis]